MQSMPFVAFVFAVIAVLIALNGFPTVALVPMALCAFAAFIGVAVGHAERPVSSRISCVMALLLATSPLTAPMLQELRLRQLERARAAETAPLYAEVDRAVGQLAPLLDAYAQAAGVFPDFNGTTPLPYINAQNAQVDPLPAPGIQPPSDPFHPQRAPMRWVAVRDYGVLMVSVGQDGVAELPLPGVFLDGTAHPLAPFAAVGQDPRLVTYDPTNGGLGLGDVVRFHGRVSQDALFGELYRAFDAAEKASPWRPTVKKRASEVDPDPQSARDAAAAEKLQATGDNLAALALASRARNVRDRYPAQWKPADFSIDRTRGVALYHLGAFRESADALIDHLGSSPNDAIAHFWLAAAMAGAGNRQAALMHISAAAQIDAASPAATASVARFEELSRGGKPAFPPPASAAWRPEPPATQPGGAPAP